MLIHSTYDYRELFQFPEESVIRKLLIYKFHADFTICGLVYNFFPLTLQVMRA